MFDMESKNSWNVSADRKDLLNYKIRWQREKPPELHSSDVHLLEHNIKV